MADLKLITVDSVEGNFIVPDYQRGYRWTEKEVTRLLDDVYNLLDHTSLNALKNSRNYCLQPIVVKKLDNGDFEIIDGQQRLTTIFLIYKFMNSGANFTLNYATRKNSSVFLEDMDLSQQEKNIDFWFMANAYKVVGAWFERKIANGKDNIRQLRRRFESLFTENVQVIWYEVDGTENGAELFARLNIGKIPLTNAELVKAMFLSLSNKNLDPRRQQEIALQWDTLEKELHDDSLWYFLTNNSPEEYQTRVDLILDLIAKKNSGDRDEYATFFYFDGLRAQKDLDKIWIQIRKTFLLLKDWHDNHDFYHKIGYLIASGYKNLAAIYKESVGKTTSEFSKRLKELIQDSIKLAPGESYSDWTYENNREQIRRLLLLFNVESVRKNGKPDEKKPPIKGAYWFPFDKFKFVDSKKSRWSLEHINAVQPQEKGKQENWREWLELHKKSLEALAEPDTALIAEIVGLLKLKELRHDKFEELQKKILQKFSPNDGTDDYINSIANLALIKCAENSALGNSTFDVKRNEIIEMDMSGEFIPFCTKMAFLKYYTKSERAQLHFWSQEDRKAYVAAINRVLKEYLAEKI